MKYRILILLACGMCLVNIWHTFHDVHDSGGTDLRVRVVGARALLRGINPYTIEDTVDLDPALRDPDREALSRCTYHPTLLFFYAPLSLLPYPMQRAIWALLEWVAFFVSVGLLSACVPSRPARFWFCVAAIGLFGSSWFWRLHVERGQYYIFVVLFISLGMWLLLRTKQSPVLSQSLHLGWPGLEGASPKPRGFLHFVQSSPGHPIPVRSIDEALAAGVFWGLAICLRPTAAVLVLPWLTGAQRKVGFTAIATAVTAVAGATVMGRLEYWMDFLQLSRTWELSLLAGAFEGNADPDVISRPTDGYNTAIMDGYAANLTFVSLSRSLQTWCASNLSPVVFARTGKVLWLIVLALIWTIALKQRHRQPMRIHDRLMVGVCLMLVTDYFLPIRVEYADMMFLIPMALLMPALILKEYRGLVLLAAFSMLIHHAPLSSLPFNAAAMTAMLRSFIVMYLVIRFTVKGETEVDSI